LNGARRYFQLLCNIRSFKHETIVCLTWLTCQISVCLAPLLAINNELSFFVNWYKLRNNMIALYI
jgi:hypothetical protein